MAGFWAGFGEQLSTNIEQRKKTLDRMIEENLDNARLAKTNYAKRKGTADQVLKSAQSIRDQYGLSDAQALALTEAYGTDLPKLQSTLDAENAKLKSNLGVSITADNVMAYTNAAENLSMPEGMTLSQGVQRLMGLNYQELSKEGNPKSEGSQTRSFIRAAFAFDPQLQAEEQMQNIKGPGGLSYAQLLEMQEAGFAPEETYGNVTRAGGLMYDYTAATAKQTRDNFSRSLSIKVIGTDLTDTNDFNNYTGEGKDKAVLRAAALGGGEALARLEKDIVLANLGQDLSMNAFRKSVLDGIYARVDSTEELQTLQESVANGTALKIVQSKGGQLTNDDIDAIIAGSAEAVAETADTETADATVTPKTAAVTEDATTETEDATTASIVAALNAEEDTPEEGPAKPADPISTADFFMANDQVILDAMEEKGITEESSRGQVKLALTELYRENQDNEAIGGYVANATIDDLERITDIVKLTLSELNPTEAVDQNPTEAVEQKPVGLMSSPRPKDRPANLGKAVDIELIKRLHGSGSKVVDTWKEKSKLPREDLRVSDVTRLIKDTQALPKTDARSTLLESLYDLRDVMNNRK